MYNPSRILYLSKTQEFWTKKIKNSENKTCVKWPCPLKNWPDSQKLYETGKFEMYRNFRKSDVIFHRQLRPFVS